MQHVNWSEESKTEAKTVLITEYTSSDESKYSEDEENEGRVLSRYLVKRLPWERARLTQLKSNLDKVYSASLSRRMRESTIRRAPHRLPSTRLPQS